MDGSHIELLQRMPIFGGIRADILEFLVQTCPSVTVGAGDFFFREGEPGDYMLALQRGEAEVLKSWRDEERALHILKAGDCFGEMAVIDHCPRSASARALTDSTAIRTSAADLYKLYSRDLKQFTLIQMNMGREVCRRLRAADAELFRRMMASPGRDSEQAAPGD